MKFLGVVISSLSDVQRVEPTHSSPSPISFYYLMRYLLQDSHDHGLNWPEAVSELIDQQVCAMTRWLIAQPFK